MPPADLLTTEIVRIGDSLGRYAHRRYGDAELWPEIFAANLHTLSDPDEIFRGQGVRIPRRANSENGSTTT